MGKGRSTVTSPSELREGTHLDILVKGMYDVETIDKLSTEPPARAQLLGWSVAEKK